MTFKYLLLASKIQDDKMRVHIKFQRWQIFSRHSRNCFSGPLNLFSPFIHHAHTTHHTSVHPGKQSFAPDSASVTQTVPEVSALYLLCVHCGLGDETGPSPGRGPSLTHSNKSHPHQLCVCKCLNSKNFWETLHISQDARPNADISSIPHTWPSD